MKNIKIIVIATALLTLTSASYAQSTDANTLPIQSKKVFVKNVKVSQTENVIKLKNGKVKNKNLNHNNDFILPIKSNKVFLKMKHVSI